MDTPRLSGKAGEDSCGSTKDELKVDLLGKTRFGHQLTPEMVRRLRPTALRYIRTWRATKDQQGCHHLRPTSQTVGYKANKGNP